MVHLTKIVVALAFISLPLSARQATESLFLVKVPAKNSAERSQLANMGVAIEGTYSDGATFFGTQEDIDRVKAAGFKTEISPLPASALDDFPLNDSAFHNVSEVNAALTELVNKNPNIAQSFTIGNSLEGRALNGVRISSQAAADSLPTAIFLGCHHAREHLSVEVPLKLAQYLVSNYATDTRVKKLLDTTEVWILPMVNPDGAEYDISSGSYRWWRKNRRQNNGMSYGVDLNRNYGKNFGGEGASSDPNSDTYHGPSAFSEPETAAVRDFVRSRKKATVLLSYHTFSELVLWPWGHTNEAISNDADRKVFETMGKKMASWNGYTPQKSSDLYVASGDTTDWAYDELGIFAFTFELSPSSIFAGGFYPGASAIEPTFKENLEPALYLIENAGDPYGVTRQATDPLGILNVARK